MSHFIVIASYIGIENILVFEKHRLINEINFVNCSTTMAMATMKKKHSMELQNWQCDQFVSFLFEHFFVILFH